MFVLSFKNDNDDLNKNYLDEYCMSLVEIKDFNALIDNKPFFYHPDVCKTCSRNNVKK